MNEDVVTDPVEHRVATAATRKATAGRVKNNMAMKSVYHIMIDRLRLGALFGAHTSNSRLRCRYSKTLGEVTRVLAIIYLTYVTL
jgi:hypothetical protein